MQAITTKYLGPTNIRGARIKASCGAGSITLGRDDALNIEQNHMRAARALAVKLNWDGRWIGGTPHVPGTGFVYVCDAGPPYSPEFTIPKVDTP